MIRKYKNIYEKDYKYKRLKYIQKFIFVNLFVLIIFSVTVVEATWILSIVNDITPVNNSQIVKLNKWENLDALPQNQEGEKHETAIKNIVSGNNGLNNKGSLISQSIEERKNKGKYYYGSYEYNDSIELEGLMGSKDMDFIVAYPNNNPNVMYLYTTSVDIGQSGVYLPGVSYFNIPVGETVYIVYRTTLVKDTKGNWIEKDIKKGSAKVMSYSNTNSGTYIYRCPAFNPDTWKEGKLGISKDDAIYTYVGQTITAYTDSGTEKIYYRLDCIKNTIYTVKINDVNSSAKVKVYNKNMSLVKVSSGAQNSKSLSWNANANGFFYIEFTGSKEINFTIS